MGSERKEGRSKRTSPETIWPSVLALTISLAASGLVDHLLETSPGLVLDEARLTSMYGGVVTMLALVISVGALVYVETLKFAGSVYTDFMNSVTGITVDTPISPRETRALYERLGAAHMDSDFLTQSTWTEAAEATRRRILDVVDTDENLFFGLALFAGLGIVVTLFSYFGPVSFVAASGPLDTAIFSVVFFAFFIYYFSTVRKTTFYLSPLVIEPREAPHSPPESR